MVIYICSAPRPKGLTVISAKPGFDELFNNVQKEFCEGKDTAELLPSLVRLRTLAVNDEQHARLLLFWCESLMRDERYHRARQLLPDLLHHARNIEGEAGRRVRGQASTWIAQANLWLGDPKEALSAAEAALEELRRVWRDEPCKPRDLAIAIRDEVRYRLEHPTFVRMGRLGRILRPGGKFDQALQRLVNEPDNDAELRVWRKGL